MNTGERPVTTCVEALPKATKKTYNIAREYAKNNKVLDIGCAQGYAHLLINDVAQHITGIDYDKKVIQKANERFSGQNMTYEVMNGEKLDFLTQSFDVVISSQSIEHIKNDEQFLKEVWRVLKDNGFFICATPNKRALVPPGEKMHEAPYYPFHSREYTPEQFYGLLGRFFQVVQRFCFYNPDRRLKFLNTQRAKWLYRLSRFAFVRWLGRRLPLSFKNFIILFNIKDKDITFVEQESATCEYHEQMDFQPEVIGGVFQKVASIKTACP